MGGDLLEQVESTQVEQLGLAFGGELFETPGETQWRQVGVDRVWVVPAIGRSSAMPLEVDHFDEAVWGGGGREWK